MESKTANGVVGYLIYDVAKQQHVLRVYDDNHDFQDYDILHSDMKIKIIDADAHFYQRNGMQHLDHSPATLGIQ
jgi:hypothetical protein